MSAEPETRRGSCRQCGLRRDVRLARRSGGGNYRRPPRLYVSSICEECAHRLLTSASPNHQSVSRWEIWALDKAWPATPSPKSHQTR